MSGKTETIDGRVEFTCEGEEGRRAALHEAMKGSQLPLERLDPHRLGHFAGSADQRDTVYKRLICTFCIALQGATRLRIPDRTKPYDAKKIEKCPCQHEPRRSRIFQVGGGIVRAGSSLQDRLDCQVSKPGSANHRESRRL